MSSKYKFRDQAKLYFVTCTVVYWLDPFIRNEYRNVLLDGIKYCQKKKGLEIYGTSCTLSKYLCKQFGTNSSDAQPPLKFAPGVPLSKQVFGLVKRNY
jgi:putative transposase